MADDARPLAAPLPVPSTEPRPRRFSRAEFDTMVKAGIIEEGSRVELIGGDIIEMPSEGFAHADAATYFIEALAGLDRQLWTVVMTSRLDVNQDTQAYPDIMVVQAGTRARDRGPDSVALLIEIAWSSLRYDRDRRGPRYAAAGFREYWIYEPDSGRLWVHRNPAPDGAWGVVTKHEAGEQIGPQFAPDMRLQLPAPFRDE